MKLMRADQIIQSLPSFFIFLTLVLVFPHCTFAAQGVTAHSQVNMNATASDFNAGYKYTSEHSIDWSSSEDWEITIKSLTSDLGDSTDSTYTKSLNDLQWKLSTSETWNTMTTNENSVTTGVSGAGSITIDYRVQLSWSSDKPGNYSASIEFKIVPLSRSISIFRELQSLKIYSLGFSELKPKQNKQNGIKRDRWHKRVKK